MKNYLFLLIATVSIFSSCIKDDIIQDFVEPTIRILSVPDTIELNTTYQFEFMYLNNIGVQENVGAVWSSSDPAIIEIDNSSGLATAIAVGSASISVEYQNGEVQVMETLNVNVGNSTVVQIQEKSGTIQTTSSYVLEGSFTLVEDGDNLILEFADDYKASAALPGLFIYFSNNRNSVANAFEIDAVETFSGAHTYVIENIGINDFEFLLYFCKPFNVKVGDGEIK